MTNHDAGIAGARGASVPWDQSRAARVYANVRVAQGERQDRGRAILLILTVCSSLAVIVLCIRSSALLSSAGSTESTSHGARSPSRQVQPRSDIPSGWRAALATGALADGGYDTGIQYVVRR